jgi:hypothetical protein
MKSFSVCFAVLAIFVPIQARKMELLAKASKASSKALATAKLPQDVTAEDILAEVPGQLSGLEDVAGSRDAVQATLPEDTISDVATQSTGGLVVQQEEGASQTGDAIAPQTGDAVLPVVDAETSQMPTNIANMENQVLRLASAAAKTGKADSAMIEMVNSIIAILNTSIKEPLNQQSTALNDNLDSLRNQMTDCYNTALNASSQATADLYNLSNLSVEHRACRQQQELLTQTASRLRSLASAYADQMAVWCGNYNQSERGYLLDGRAQCLVDHGDYHGTWWLSRFYQDQSAFWENLYNIVVAARLRCENATAIWQQADNNASAAEAAVTIKTAECDQDQMQMDGASCSFKAYIDGLWSADISEWHSSTTGCYTTADATFNSSYAHAVTETDYLNVQLKGIWRIECYLSAFIQANISSHIEHCQSRQYANATTLYDGSIGYFYPYPCDWSCTTIGTTPPPPVAPHECAGRYSNVSDIAGTPDYENAHYYPYKALVFECNATCCPNPCR